MATFNRADVRKHFADLLRAAITGENGLAQEVRADAPNDLGGVSPLVLVTSGTISRKQHGMDGKRYAGKVVLDVLVFVARENAAEGWTSEMVEDALDNIEAAIADVVAANRRTAYWTHIDYDGNPTGAPMPAAGGYMVETIRITADCTG